MKYLATFASGFSDVVRELLPKTLPIGQSLRLFDGAAFFESQYLVDLHFANNVFAIFDEVKWKTNINNYIKRLILKEFEFNSTAGKKTFRIITSDKNQLVSVNNKLKSQLEQKIAKSTGLKLDRNGSDVEFWILKRSEGVIFFMERLTKNKDYAKTLKRGQIHPPIAYMLNFLSEPTRGELYLDPFCGSGALPESRVKHFGDAKVYTKAYANDIIPIEVKDYYFSNKDFFKYDFGGLVFDKIVTDPPWGKYDANLDVNKFYKVFFEKAEKLLREGGILVLLTARDIKIEKFAVGFKIVKKLDVLISGPKASVYKMVKTSAGPYDSLSLINNKNKKI